MEDIQKDNPDKQDITYEPVLYKNFDHMIGGVYNVIAGNDYPAIRAIEGDALTLEIGHIVGSQFQSIATVEGIKRKNMPIETILELEAEAFKEFGKYCTLISGDSVVRKPTYLEK